MTVTAPPRPPRPSDPVTHKEFDALVEALIEEARRRGLRRRRRNVAIVTLAALVGVVLFAFLGRSAQSQTASPAVSVRINAAAQATSTIAYLREPLNSGYCGTVWVMNPDGSGQRRLTNGGVPGCGQERDHAWSPDGRQIAFVSNWQVWVMNADGSGQRRLTHNGARNFAPAWSPDGRRIVFERRVGRVNYGRCNACGRAANFQVYGMNADGSGARMLARNAAQPVWSADGLMLAFTRQFDIYVMNADGSGQRNLTRTPGGAEHSPAWSPAQK